MRDEDHGPTKTAANAKAPPRTADAVAVALAKDIGAGTPPKVVASGRGRVAEQILEIAFANGVRVREDSGLAQLLSAIEVESDIPVEAFAVVAEILIYVYRANGDPLAGNLDPADWTQATETGKDTR